MKNATIVASGPTVSTGPMIAPKRSFSRSKPQVITIHFRVQIVRFPKQHAISATDPLDISSSPETLSESLHKDPDDYTIARCRVLEANSQTWQTATVKGNFYTRSCRFIQTGGAYKTSSNYDGGACYTLNKAHVQGRRDPCTLHTLHQILVEDLHQKPAAATAMLHNAMTAGSRSELAVVSRRSSNTSAVAMSTQRPATVRFTRHDGPLWTLVQDTEYVQLGPKTPGDELLRLFPNDTTLLRHRKETANVASLAIVKGCPLVFAVKRPRQLGLGDSSDNSDSGDDETLLTTTMCTETANKLPSLDKLEWLQAHPFRSALTADKLQIFSKVPQLDMAALTLHHELSRWCVKHGHTVFYPLHLRARQAASDKSLGHYYNTNDVPPYELDMAPFMRLLDVGLVVLCVVGDSPTYTLRRDHVYRSGVLQALTNVRKRFATATNASGTTDTEMVALPALAANFSLQQVAALQAVRTQYLTCVVGSPGCGKTRVIEAVVADTYNSSSSDADDDTATSPVLVVSYVGAMVDALRGRSVIGACTIHSVLAAAAHQTPTYKKTYIAARVLIVDECSNVDIKLLARLLAVLPALERILLVFDPEQIPPISQGQPALDILKALPNFCIHLTTNYRVQSASPSDPSYVLLQNGEAMSCHRPNAMQFKSFPDNSLKQRTASAGPLVGAFMYPMGSDNSACIHLYTTLVSLSPPASQHATKTHYTTEEVQVLALTNRIVATINTAIDSYVYAQLYKGPANTRAPWLYVGQRIAITKNCPERLLVLCTPPSTGPQVTKQQQQQQYAIQKKRCPRSSEVFNGEQYMVSRIAIWNACKFRWEPEDQEPRILATRQQAYLESGPTATRFHCVFMSCGKMICLHPRFVTANVLAPGWAITVNKSQGREYPCTIFALGDTPPDKAAQRAALDLGFFRNHAHVALTRARRCCVVLGDKPRLRNVCRRPPPVRYSQLRYGLETHFKKTQM